MAKDSSSKKSKKYSVDNYLGLEKYARQIKLHTAGGKHNTIFSKENIDHICEILENLI